MQKSVNYRDLNRGKPSALGFFEQMKMKYAGFSDGRHGLLRHNAEGIYVSCTLQQEVNSCEEYSAELFGRLQLEQKELFREIYVLFDSIPSLRIRLAEAKRKLEQTEAAPYDPHQRKEGEQKLTDEQVAARRGRERETKLIPLREEVVNSYTLLTETVDSIFEKLSFLKERTDSSVLVLNRVRQHTQRRIDIYWRSAMKQMKELPPVAEVRFSNISQEIFEEHYREVEIRAEQLRAELTGAFYGEV